MLHTSLATQIQQCIAKPGFCVANCDAKPGETRLLMYIRISKTTGKNLQFPNQRLAPTWQHVLPH